MRIVVLASGGGSNLRAIGAAIDAGRCAAEIAAVVSDRGGTGALAWAEGRGIATRVVSPKEYATREAWDVEIARVTAAYEPRLVVLAGFMRIVGGAMLSAFPSAIINVHPALLPAFPGKDGPAQALAHGVRIAGCTVHIVDAGVDTGPILAQGAVPVIDGDDATTLHARIQAVEHVLLPSVIDAIARGEVLLGERPRVLRRVDPRASLLAPAP